MAGIRSSLLLPAGGLLLGVVGLTTTWDKRCALWSIFGASTPDPIPLVAREVEALRAQGARFIIVLSHQGTPGDVRLAEAVPGIGLIVAGHDHRALEQPLVAGETWIVSAGDYGRYLGRVDLEIDAASGQVGERQARLVPVSAEAPGDPRVLDALAGERSQVEALLAMPVGRLDQDLDLASDRECGMGDLLADALRERLGAEIGLCAPGDLAGGLVAGRLTLGDLCRACSCPGNPAKAALTGEQILELLNRGLSPEVYNAMPKPLRGQKVGIPQVSGLSYHWRPGAPSHERLRDVRVGGARLDPARTYSVAASDIEFSEAFGYLGLPYDRLNLEVPTILREVLQEHMARHSTVRVEVGGRITSED